MEKEFGESFILKPRDYQKAIYETCKDKDCLVVLPTGTGKTLIAIMMTTHRFKKFPLEKILVLAPTRPLIEQHLESFKKNLSEGWADMQIFTGKTPAGKRKEIWQTAEIVFSTPQCISNDLKKGLYNLEDVSLLVVDECHRCLKNYAYNYVAQSYKKDSVNRRILGMTASPGSDKEVISQVCKNLGIEAVEVRTRESTDVKPYLQELEFEKVEVDFPSEMEEIRTLLQEIERDKINEMKNRGILIGSGSKVMLLKIQNRLMNELKRSRDFNKMLGVSACAQALKISHAIELIETQTISSLVEYLRGLYKQAEERKSKGIQRLVKDLRFSKAYTLATTFGREHPKVYALKEIVEKQFEKNPKSKIIVFAQFRETVRKLASELEKMNGIKTGIFVGQAIKKHGKETTGLKQKEQKEMVKKFSEGEINVLVATSIAEEGLDIPEVSMVIFYEPIPSAIRNIQRRGRTARLAPGSLKILVTKNTRDQIYHYAAYHKERRMHSAIDQIKKDLDNGKGFAEEQSKL
ncbi:MAG: DEAD/DEAH box helicase [Candidatus Pacearchaeota archaeon]